MTCNKDARFPIGTKFKTRHSKTKFCTVVDILKTYNNQGDLVQIRYVATHDFMGGIITDRDVVETTIAMGLVDNDSSISPEEI